LESSHRTWADGIRNAAQVWPLILKKMFVQMLCDGFVTWFYLYLLMCGDEASEGGGPVTGALRQCQCVQGNPS